MRPIIDTAKNVIEKAKVYAYHKEQNRNARKYLNSIESEKGKLDHKLKNLCVEYAKDIFLDEKYAPWLFVYCANAQDFKEGWMPDNYYGEIVLPNMNAEYGKICNRKSVVSRLLNESNSLDICFFVNNLFLSTDNEFIDKRNIKSFLFSQNKKIVFKQENSRQGKGVYFFDEKSFNIANIKKLGNGVFQSYIDQHPFFSDFSKSAVATIRLTSICNNNGEIELRAGYFRFGSKNETHVMSDSAMKIAVNINNGTLDSKAYFPSWKSTTRLVTNVPFAGKELPAFNDCVTEIKKLHKQIPFIRCVGWDVIVDKDNQVRIIELNGGHNSITFNETIQGPCFKGLGWENLKKNH